MMNSSPASTPDPLSLKGLVTQLRQRLQHEGVRRYGSNTFWSLITRVAGSIISLAVTIYLARYLGPANYGHLSYAISFVGLFSIIASLGIDTVLYRELIKYPDKKPSLLGSAFCIKFCAGLVAAVGTVIAALTLATDDVSRPIIFMLAITFPFYAFNVIIYEFQSHVNQKPISIASFILILLLNILKLLVIAFDKGVLYIGAIITLEAIIYAVMYCVLRFHYYGSVLDWRIKTQYIRSLLIDAWPFIFVALFSSIYARIDQIMLNHLLDSSAVGIYDAGVRLAEAWLIIPGIVVSSLFPAIINGHKTSIRQYKKRLLALSGLLAGVATIIAIVTFLVASPLINLIYGPAFATSANVLKIYTWSGIFVAISMVLQYFLLNENKQRLIFFSALGTMIINVLLNLWLIPLYGVTGAAWATFVSYAILALPIILVFTLPKS